MRVIFVAVGAEQLPISLLSAILRRAGHEVGLAFSQHLFDDQVLLSVPALAKAFRDDDAVLDQIVRFRPDVVCFSALSMNYRWMLEVAERAKELTGAVTIFGGVHPSAVPEVVLEEKAVDYVCVGEGDLALPLLLDSLRKGRPATPPPNMAFRGPGGRPAYGPRLPFFQDLDRLPPFEKDLWQDHVRLDAEYLTMSARGCPYRCTFCFNNFFANIPGKDKTANGRYVRQRSVDHFIRELVTAKRRYRSRVVHIEDDIFTINPAWIKEFSRRYRQEVGLPFFCLSHVQYLDADRVADLKEAGCVTVQLGMQSADDDYKKAIRRYEKMDQFDRSIHLLEKAGIGIQLDHIFGLPNENLDAQRVALGLYARHDPIRINTYWLTYYPGTEMLDQARRQDLVTAADADLIDRGYQNSYLTDAHVSLSPELRRTYLAYSLVFHLLPILPGWLRRRVGPRHVRWLTPSLARGVILVVGLLAGIVRRHFYLPVYFRYYLHGIENHLRWRMKLPPRRRFGDAFTGPLRDPSWDRLYAEFTASLRVAARSEDAEPALVGGRKAS